MKDCNTDIYISTKQLRHHSGPTVSQGWDDSVHDETLVSKLDLKVLSFNFIKGQKVDFLLRAGESPGSRSMYRSAALRGVARLVLGDVSELVSLAGVGRAGGQVGAAHGGRVYPGVSRGGVISGPDPLLARLLSRLDSSRFVRLHSLCCLQGRALLGSCLGGTGRWWGVEDQT